MSQYLNFFARHDKEFVPIADYSRNTVIYDEVVAPYGKLKKFNDHDLETISNRLRADKKFAEAQIENINYKMELIFSANNSLEDKLNMANEELELIESYKNDIRDCDRYVTELSFIANMTTDNEIFVGIEVGEPTERDIIEG